MFPNIHHDLLFSVLLVWIFSHLSLSFNGGGEPSEVFGLDKTRTEASSTANWASHIKAHAQGLHRRDKTPLTSSTTRTTSSKKPTPSKSTKSTSSRVTSSHTTKVTTSKRTTTAKTAKSPTTSKTTKSTTSKRSTSSHSKSTSKTRPSSTSLSSQYSITSSSDASSEIPAFTSQTTSSTYELDVQSTSLVTPAYESPTSDTQIITPPTTSILTSDSVATSYDFLPSTTTSEIAITDRVSSSAIESASPTSTEDLPTGVTYSVDDSRSSCYQPFSISSFSRISFNETSSTSLGSPVDFYIDSDGNSANIFSINAPETYLTYDMTDPTKLAIIASDGSVLTVNTSGIYIYSADCTAEISILIDNFADLINEETLDSSSTRRHRRQDHPQSLRYLSKRMETSFEADISVVDGCGNPFNDASPSVSVGPSPCALDHTQDGTFFFLCQYPGEESSHTTCEHSISGVLDFFSSGFVGGLTNYASAGKVASNIVQNPSVRKVLLHYVGLLAEEGLMLASIEYLALFEVAMLVIPPKYIAAGACALFFLNDPKPVIANGQTVQIISSAPETPVTATITAGGAGECEDDGGSAATSTTASSTSSAVPTGGSLFQCPTRGCEQIPTCQNGCSCLNDVQGVGHCGQDVSQIIGGIYCNLNEDCGPGFFCAPNTCQYFPICMQICVDDQPYKTYCILEGSELNCMDTS